MTTSTVRFVDGSSLSSRRARRRCSRSPARRSWSAAGQGELAAVRAGDREVPLDPMAAGRRATARSTLHRREQRRGAMGQHYVRGSLVGDPAINPLTPEAVIYEPMPGGGYRLVGVEYVVFKADWDKNHSSRPRCSTSTFFTIPGGQPLRTAGLLRAPRVDVAAEPERHVRELEPEGQLPRQRRPGLTKPTSGGAPRGRRPTAASGGRVGWRPLATGAAGASPLVRSAHVRSRHRPACRRPRHPRRRMRRHVSASAARTRAAAAGPGPSGARPSSNLGYTVLSKLDPRSACVLHPDPANGGNPKPPAPVVEAGDPADPSGVVEVTAVGLGDIALPSDQLLVADYFTMHSYFLPDMARVQLHGFTGRAPVCAAPGTLPTTRPADRLPPRPSPRRAGRALDHRNGGIRRRRRDGRHRVGGGAAGRDRGRANGLLLRRHQRARHGRHLGLGEHHYRPVSGANVIGFSTGYGDGGYPVYAGLGRDGKVASVVIDFFVLPWRWLGRMGTISRS